MPRGRAPVNIKSCASAPNRRLLAAVLFGVLVFPFPASGENRPYRLAPGDRIAVTVFGQPELSGDILVDDAGAIVLPLLDAIEVKDLTIGECQNLIASRLAAGVLREPAVNVRLSEPRPIYVLGDVRTPGLYPFRYGATALSAVAIAGGFGPSELIRSTAVSEFLAADQTLRQLTFQHRALLARRARLEAQRDGKESFSTPALDDPAQTSIVANEKDMFLTQATILQNQLYLLQSQKPRLERQIEAHKEGIAAGNKQLALIKEQVDRYRGLLKQGLGTQTAAFQFSVLEANQESTVWRLAAEISRLEMDAGELDLKIQDAEASFKRQVATELHDVRERLNEMDVTLPAARQIRDVKLRYAGGDVIKHSISITRVQNGKPVVLDATETTSLEPGDIVNIEPLFPRDSPAYGSAELPDLQRSQTVTAESPTGLVPR